MIECITHWDRIHPILDKATGQVATHKLSDVMLLPPVERPGKIMGIGLNYGSHAEESGQASAEQMWFTKAVTSISAPYATIDLPIVSHQLDYEAELVAVIGKRCRHVDPDSAADYVFGYCAGNDATIRDWQFKTSQFTLGKSFDTLAPIGPWIVTADDIDPQNLAIKCFVNGEERQSAHTSEMIFKVCDQIAYLSKAMTLEPGDLIFTGTPGGVGAARSPQLWLEAGDRVRVEIEHIGSIENEVVAERRPS
jgi:2-keto-4-pentenoate hydratase/2-oxohepta-3-ene-1,7-dioic acid hydratase in catechol pathway